MKVQDIVAQAQDSGLFSDGMYSHTPQKSMQARLSMEIVRNGDRSTFVRTGKGVFFLRELLSKKVTNEIESGSLALDPNGTLTQYKAKPRLPRKTTENVLVIPATACKEILSFQGLRTNTKLQLGNLLTSEVKHIPRTTAEETENFKQVITYVLVTHGTNVLCFRRGRFNRAAQFLRGCLCIGFGGHVTEADYSLFTANDFGIRQNAVRELSEEIRVEGLEPIAESTNLKFLGLVNDNSTPLGRKHLAVVFQYEVPAQDWERWKNAQKREMSINELRWIDTASESINLVEFEYWSQLCWRTLSPKTIAAQAEYRILRKKPFQAPHILAVVGGIGSGKSAATRILIEKIGYAQVNSGEVLASLLGIPPVPVTPRRAFQERAWEFITRPNGPEYLASALYDAAMNSGGDYAIVDGIRQQATLEALRGKTNGALALLFVYATPDLALRLYCQREGLNEAEYEAEFFKIVGAEVESEIHLMMNSADAVIYNWSGEENYESTISNMIEGIQYKNKAGSQ